MTSTITLSPELHEALQKLAAVEQLSVDELVENLLSEYLGEQAALLDQHPDEEELAAVRQTYEEAYKPGAKWYSLEEAEAKVNNLLDENEQAEGKRYAS